MKMQGMKRRDMRKPCRICKESLVMHVYDCHDYQGRRVGVVDTGDEWSQTKFSHHPIPSDR